MRVLILCALLLFPLAASAQIVSGPPSYCCGPSYNYCEACAEEPVTTSVTYGFFRGRSVVFSECNNEGNIFFGNTIVVGGWGFQTTYWYDWSTDPNAAVKALIWQSTPWNEPLTVTYDPVTMRAITVTSPSFP